MASIPTAGPVRQHHEKTSGGTLVLGDLAGNGPAKEAGVRSGWHVSLHETLALGGEDFGQLVKRKPVDKRLKYIKIKQ